MALRCPRSLMNASRLFASTLNKRSRRQRSHSALAHTYPPPRRLNTAHFGGVEDFETVAPTEYRNVTRLRTERGFSSGYVNETRRPGVMIRGAVSCSRCWKLSAWPHCGLSNRCLV